MIKFRIDSHDVETYLNSNTYVIYFNYNNGYACTTMYLDMSKLALIQEPDYILTSRQRNLLIKRLEKEYNKVKLLETATSMVNDYLYYGYTINYWIKQDYPITRALGINTIKELFRKQAEILGKIA